MKKQINAHPRTTQISESLKARLESGAPLQAELLAVSRAGHDKDTLYVVLAEENEYFWKAQRARITEKEKKDTCTADPSSSTGGGSAAAVDRAGRTSAKSHKTLRKEPEFKQ